MGSDASASNPTHPAAVRMKRQRLLKRKISGLLREADPVGPIAGGPLSDHHLPTLQATVGQLTRARSVEGVREVVHLVFTEWFGEAAGPAHHYSALANRIWSALQEYRGGTREQPGR